MKVIVAIDDSPFSADVVDSVSKWPWPDQIDFKILTVLEPLCDCLNDTELTDYSDTVAAIEERRRLAAEGRSEKICRKIKAVVPGATTLIEIREGLPRVEIVNAAVDWGADRILIGAHGKDVCPRNILGSVSRAVVSHAPCSVEVIRSSPSLKDNSAINEVESCFCG